MHLKKNKKTHLCCLTVLFKGLGFTLYSNAILCDKIPGYGKNGGDLKLLLIDSTPKKKKQKTIQLFIELYITLGVFTELCSHEVQPIQPQYTLNTNMLKLKKITEKHLKNSFF